MAKKIRGELGPFKTDATVRDGGERKIEIVRITPTAMTYRAVGHSETYTIPHETMYLRAVAAKIGFDPGANLGRLKRTLI